MSNTADTSTEWVEIERELSAPPDVVWQMWTDPEHFKAWYGPMGASIPVAELDVRVGGRRLICMEMTTPNGDMSMWFTGEFTEVDTPTRLAYTDLMSDDQGNPVPAEQLPPGHPSTTTVIVDLVAVDGGTKMTMTHVGVPAGSGGEGGWAMAFDKLVDHIASS